MPASSVVVCPIEDPNPLVSGRGFEHLRSAGVEVVTGILAEEAERLNENFICWHKKQRPFVHLKMAMSLDGRISVDDSVSTALSGDIARGRVRNYGTSTTRSSSAGTPRRSTTRA